MPAEQDVDPERHLKRLQKVFGVSKRLKELATNTLKTDGSTHELIKEAEALTRAKAFRAKRTGCIEPHHQYLIDLVAEMLDIPTDEVTAGMADADQNINLLQSIMEKMGVTAVIFQYDNFPHPSRGKCIFCKCFEGST